MARLSIKNMAGKTIVVPTIYLKTRTQWRTWLKKNHQKKSEIWLISYKQATGKPTIPFTDALAEALCFGWIDVRVMRIDTERYMTRYVPRGPKSSWSKINMALYHQLEKQKLMTAAGRATFTSRLHSGS